ncbi:Serine/threonine-protein phosphatase 2A regulatory subunit A beta isoform [Paragonimus westermani]|uniref:Serine/threonine-protein phosphatase 2A regulatory subunit A beta isoform n=1 Tax=Paragonimus westermani TaxID=34504 RepID=A0A8T0DJ98_9TREM|nr:Serine/threonine-protein phosphatase 2A regulatory subunit A beta isoform [Paragonimus westermani]
MSMEAQEAYYPIAVLIEELRNDDVQLRLNSIRQLKTIALTLGPEKTRSQLIPFITDTVCDEDEILFALAEQLGTLVPYVGGPEHAASLLPPLEGLAAVEEVSVRDKAVESMRKIATLHTTEAMEFHFYPVVHHLAAGDWFTSRTSACALLSTAYPRVRAALRQELLEILKKLATDETPMVKRAVAGRLGELALVMVGGEAKGVGNKTPIQNGSIQNNSCGTETKDSKAFAGPVDEQQSTAVSLGGDVSITDGSTGTPASPPSNDLALDPSVERNNLLTVIVPMLSDLILDDQESVRLMAVESLVGIVQALGPTESAVDVVELIQNTVSDMSWRVRCMVAERFIDLFVSLDPTVARSRLVPIFLELLRDEEAEVRALTAGKIRSLARCLLGLPPTDPNAVNTSAQLQENPPTTVPDIESTDALQSGTNLPATYKLLMDSDINMEETSAIAAADETIVSGLLTAIKMRTNDSNSHVRSAMANAILGLAPLIGSALTIEHLLPVLLVYLKDDSPEVRFNLISNLEHMNNVIGLDQVSNSLLPSVIQLAEDPKWRVRLVLIEYIPSLAEQLGLEVFNTQLTGICLRWLVDEVCAIREAAVENIIRLGSKFGTEWINETFIPKVVKLAKNENYLHRMICLESIIRLSEVVEPSVCRQRLLPTTLAMHTDNVPNVRFKVAQALSKLGGRLEPKDVSAEIETCLRHLSGDTDSDVRFYADEAMYALHILPEPEKRSTRPESLLLATHALRIEPSSYGTPTPTPTASEKDAPLNDDHLGHAIPMDIPDLHATAMSVERLPSEPADVVCNNSS